MWRNSEGEWATPDIADVILLHRYMGAGRETLLLGNLQRTEFVSYTAVMVAARGTLSHAGTHTPNAVVRHMGIGPVRFTIDDALRMVERGILPEDSTVELLDGELVYRDRFDLRGSEIVEGFRHNTVQLSITTDASSCLVGCGT